MDSDAPATQSAPDATPQPDSQIPVAPWNNDPACQAFVERLHYLESAEIAQIVETYAFSAEAHQGQKRVSGEPYITHPLAVATSLAEWHLDAPVIVAGLLHDVMEDTEVSKAEITLRFGRSVAELVDGVSKLDRLEFQSYQDAQAENFRKMLMAMARDVRVVLIKLADRLHNMRTLAAMRPDKRRRISRETLEIYAPIAIRLGLNHISRQLQDLSFQQLHPTRFQVLSRAIKAAHGNRRELLSRILTGIRNKLHEANIDAGVFGREKSIYSIYNKMIEKHLSFSQVLDIYGFRIVVGDVSTCYRALGVLHALYKPVPGKFKDYIAIPKVNGYQSLHTTLIGPYGTPVEIQIRTQTMHHIAEQGIASHWLYKDSADGSADLQEKTSKWLQSLLELQSTSGDSSEFLEHVKVDLFPDEVYVFTPKGRILALPRGATVIDFAYAVHTDIGHRCTAAQIDNQLIPLSAELANGNQVEIITAPHANPNPAWLEHVKTSRARSRIRQFLKAQQIDGASLLGENMLHQELHLLRVTPAEIPTPVWDRLLRDSGKKSWRELYADIGMGHTLAAAIAHRLADHEAVEQGEAQETVPVVIRGTEGMAIQLASCCHPIPGDPIIGLLREGQGLQIHTHSCTCVRKSRSTEPNNWIHVDWQADPEKVFDIAIKVTTRDVRGALGRVATEIAQTGIDIVEVHMDNNNPGMTAILSFLIQVADRKHLARLIRHLRHVPDVIRIVRDQAQ